MALKNGKVKKSSESNESRVIESIGSTDAMGNRDSKASIKFSSWSQTSNDVTIILHTGRNFSSKEISVNFTDQNVKVGLTDGRKWSCWFYAPIVGSSAKVQLRKMKLLLIAKKKVPDVEWASYEKVDADSSSASESDCSVKPSSCFEIKSLMKAKSAVSDSEYRRAAVAPLSSETLPRHAEHIDKRSRSKTNSDKETRTEGPLLPMAGNGDEATRKDDIEMSQIAGEAATLESSLPLTVIGGTGSDAVVKVAPINSAELLSRDIGSSCDGHSMTPTSLLDGEFVSEAVESMEYDETESLLSASTHAPEMLDCRGSDELPKKRDANETVEQTSKSEPSSDEDLQLESTPLISSQENREVGAETGMETSDVLENVKDLELVKHDFYEKSDVVVLTVYVKQIKKESLRVIFGETNVEIVFQTSEPKFLNLYEETTADTYFQWKLVLASTIEVEKCNFRLMPSNLVINLFKKVVAKKWGTLTALPQMSSVAPPTAQNTWMPTCQKEVGGMSSGSSKPKQAGTVVFDELSGTSARSNGDSPSVSKKDFPSVNKPTCKVSPLTSGYGEGYGTSSSSKLPIVVTNPGMMGLDNIGNTCFMNSVLQVLANTVDLRDYFLDGSYQKELNCDNPLGMGGKLAVAFGYLMKVLWTLNQSSFEPSKLKSLVATKQTRFVGYSQHDAEEFMEFLLDGLHEDLNRVQEKPYFEEKDITGNSDEVIADESWRRHKLRNDSHIIDVFQGQYHSRVVCPTCETVSITFDPFSIIQVPIPKEKKLVNVIFMPANPSNRPVKYPIQIGMDANVNHLKDVLYQRTKVRPENTRILKVSQCQIASEFTPGMSLQEITARDLLVACAVLSKNDIGEPVREFTVVQRTLLPKKVPSCCNYCHKENSFNVQLKRCTKCYTASYCDQDCQKKDWTKHKLLCQLQGEPVGCPFIIGIPESKMTFSYLCSTIENYARYSVNAFQPPPLARKAPSSRASSMSSSVSSLSSSISEPSEELGASDKEFSESVSDASEFVNPNESIVKAESVGSDVPAREDPTAAPSETGSSSSQPPVRCVLGTQQNTAPAPPPPFFLRPCTRNGTILNSWQRLQDSGDDLLPLDTCRSLLVEWKNKEDCTPYVEVETKELEYEECESKFHSGNNLNVSYNSDITLSDCLNLFTEPEVLHPDQTWFCSKCKMHRQATKEISIWRLPPTLIIHLKRFSFSSMFWRNKIDDKVTFPLSGLDMTPYLKRPLSPGEPPPIYDLYGVVNHRGDLVGGHYTAFARCPNPEDFTKSHVDWRYFDDSHVTTCNAKNVNSQFAYVLFYRQRIAGLTFKENLRMEVAPPISKVPEIITNGHQTIKQAAAVVRDAKLDGRDDMDTVSESAVELDSVQMEGDDDDDDDEDDSAAMSEDARGISDSVAVGGKDINAID